ncbi:MAG: hypothetical protein O2854_08700, partial [Chloroflexi bacterium]|nr:hypothetical protein [Chloroflexota bacterium]
MLRSGLAKKRAIGIVLLVVGLALFLTYSQLPQLNDVHSTTTTQSEVQCFQGYCIEVGANASFGRRWADFSLTYLKSIAPGMTFAFLITGIVTALLVPPGSRLFPDSTWLGRTLNGVLRRDSKTSRTGLSLSMAAVVMAALVFTPVLGVSRIVLGVAGALFLTAVLGWLTRRGSDEGEERFTEPDEAGWLDAAAEGLRGWSGASIGYLVRLGPLMVGVALLGGLVVQWVSPEDVEPFLGNNVAGVVIAAAGGLLLSLPLMFEIGLVAFLLILGMGEGPATALLFTAA